MLFAQAAATRQLLRRRKKRAKNIRAFHAAARRSSAFQYRAASA
jgi:hypothetical protein